MATPKQRDERRTPRRKLPLSRKLLFSAATVLAIFGLPELLLRLFWEPPPAEPVVGQRQFVEWLSQLSLDSRSGRQLYRQDRQRLWSLVPGAQIESFNPHYDPRAGERQAIRIRINEDGYRGPRAAPRKQPGTLRVLCLGDSNIFGYPLDDEDVFPRALARALARERAPGSVEVINAGIPGYTVLQGRIWYEQQFADYDFDWLLLSYLNNDAWPQPHCDSVLLARRPALAEWLSELGSTIQLVRWGRAWRNQGLWERALVPRVSLKEFLAGYEALIQSAGKKGANVLILDFRAYGAYKPYSTALEQLAASTGAQYLMVMAGCRDALNNPQELAPYEDRLLRAQRRWGPMLQERPHLWLYAEANPEHLNEAGTAWLADHVRPILLE
jgi:lysophospholipase L1-like esterase